MNMRKAMRKDEIYHLIVAEFFNTAEGEDIQVKTGYNTWAKDGHISFKTGVMRASWDFRFSSHRFGRNIEIKWIRKREYPSMTVDIGTSARTEKWTIRTSVMLVKPKQQWKEGSPR